MSFFKRKEKNVIPEPERPDYSRQGSAGGPVGGGSGGGSNNSRGGLFGKKKEEADPEGFEKLPGRKYQRDQYNYQPSQRQQPAGGYGNYGNYQQQQPGAGEQQRDAGPGGAAAGGYGAYGGYQNNPDARNELFKGSRPPNSQTGAAFDQYAGSGGNRSGAPGNRAAAGQQSDAPDYGEGGQEDAGDGYGQDQEQTEEDDEVEAIKQQIRFTKQESLSATRNAIRTAREAEETATNTLAKLGQQTDRISNTELALDRAKGYNSRAADGAKEIKRLNQSIFNIQFNKAAKRDAEEQRILARHLEEKADREEARQAAFASRQRVEQGFREAEQSTRGRFGFNRGGGSSNNDDGEGLSGAPKTGRAKWEQGGRYQFEATNSDDELEQELDGNLDEIAGLTSRLKILASTAGKEIDAQNKHLDKVSGKVDTLDDKILMNTQYLKRIK